MTTDELPEGWAQVTGNELFRWSSGKFLPKSEQQCGPYPVYGGNGVAGMHDAFLTAYPTLVVGRVGALCGNVYCTPEKAWVTDNAIYATAVSQAVHLTYAHLCLANANLNANAAGSGQPYVNQGVLNGIEIPLPPLAEQQRIVAAVERILDKVTAARARLDRVPTTLKRFRQAVLAAACSGRLTADWRSTSGGETGGELLPSRWELRPLGEISTRVTDGTHQPPPLAESGIPFVLIGNVVGRKIDWTAIRKWVTQETYEKLTARCRPERGDVLYTAVGATFGQAFTVETDRAFIFQRHIAHIKPNKAQVDPSYLALTLNSPGQYEHAKEVARGAAQPTVTLSDLKQYEIPLPPLAEQQEIVKRVSALFARADAIEATVTAARKRVDTLTQAVLTKAFRGELVPTEAELARRENRPYEPAAELLARIRQSADPTPKPKRTRKSKNASQA